MPPEDPKTREMILHCTIMFSLLEKKVREIIVLDDAQCNICRTIFKPRILKRRQYLLQEGYPCRYQAFVEKGMLRSYSLDDRGGEHILQFASEGWWISDLYSFFTQEASPFYIEALEDSQILINISKGRFGRSIANHVAIFRRYVTNIIHKKYY